MITLSQWWTLNAAEFAHSTAAAADEAEAEALPLTVVAEAPSRGRWSRRSSSDK